MRSAASGMAFVIVGICFAAAAASAATLRVPSAFPTIQAAIGAASAGDTVLVADGTYRGAGNRDVDYGGKDLVVRSEHGADVTVIDCQGLSGAPHRGFFFHQGETNAAVLDGFTVTNGYVINAMNGGGIACDEGSPTIRNCVLAGNFVEMFGSDGGGIYLRECTARVEGCTVRGNFASYGGGIACRGTHSPTITDCTVIGNRANYGGGVDAGGVGAPVISDCVISGNLIQGGSGQYGSGGGMVLGGSAMVIGCTITGNASGFGAGVACWSETPAIVGCTIAGNHCQHDAGGGLAALNSNPSVRQTILWGNCADGGGDEIEADGGTVSIGCSIFDPAGVRENGGAVQYEAGDVDADPLFCAAAPCADAPTTGGTYSVMRSSPACPDRNPCGEWIGALRVGCPTAGAPDPASGAGLLRVLGNPVTDALRCRIDLPRPGRVALELLDVQGRLVRTLRDSEMAAGATTLELSLAAAAGERRIDPGVYLLSVRALGRTEARSIVLIR